MSLRKLSEKDHILQRPAMYIGAVDITTSNEYIFDGSKIEYKKVQYVPGLIKIINEIIDNSVDVAIKSNFKECNQINVKITETFVDVQDNGTGIPVIENEDGHMLPELAWGHARAGSNFDDDDNRTQIGMNGVGSFATNCFSKKFVGVSDDGTNKYTITYKDNSGSFTGKTEKSSGTSGVHVNFWPDLARFGINTIDDIHMDIIKQRLINLSMSFPEITFKFNGKKINVATFKKYVSLFAEGGEIYETDDYRFALIPNEADDFRQITYVNGLKIPDGGRHVDTIMETISYGLRDKIQKRYKNIKPGDIKNKLMLVGFFKNLKNAKFNSQSKEKITNSTAEINKYLGSIPYDKITTKMFSNKAIIEPITEIYKFKEELKKRQELKGLKTTKKIKSDKYTPATRRKKYLMVSEGDSAVGGLMPVLGRDYCGFYALKGKPLNAYSATHQQFISNTELSELFKIIQNEGYEKIGIATDADLDGIHICGLLIGFFERYLPEWKDGKIGIFRTPVKAIKRKNVPVRWAYDLNEELTPKAGEEFKYYKGLGTWKEKDLKHIVEKDGMENMLDILEFDDPEIIEDWLGDDSEPRKKYLQENNFSIAKL